MDQNQTYNVHHLNPYFDNIFHVAGVNSPNTIDVGFNELYWTSDVTPTVWHMSKLGHGVNVTVNMSYTVLPQDFVIFHPQKYPKGPESECSLINFFVCQSKSANVRIFLHQLQLSSFIIRSIATCLIHH